MSPRSSLLLVLALTASACADAGLPVADGAPVAAVAANTRSAARERLTRALALALADSGVRAAVKRRLDASNAPEGKLQFQALMHADQAALLADIARHASRQPAELLADLDAARNLEIYLPVPAQRAAWNGNSELLVATLDHDGDAPVAFTLGGERLVLDAHTPPATPVLALVPQETDFTNGHPDRLLACVDVCGGGDDGSGSGSGTNGSGVNYGSTYGAASRIGEPGLYLIQSHFGDTYEGWLKGAPEFEYHVYGLGDNGETVQLACTGEKAGGAYNWDQNQLDWTGQAMLLSDADYNAYQAKHPGAPIRIMAWEDDDESCVDHADVNSIDALVTGVDAAYKSLTSGKIDPFYLRGIRAAPSIFSIITALHNIILTNDDFIGNAVEGTVTNDAPGTSNWVTKSNGTATTGWFTTQRM